MQDIKNGNKLHRPVWPTVLKSSGVLLHPPPTPLEQKRACATSMSTTATSEMLKKEHAAVTWKNSSPPRGVGPKSNMLLKKSQASFLLVLWLLYCICLFFSHGVTRKLLGWSSWSSCCLRSSGSAKASFAALRGHRTHCLLSQWPSPGFVEIRAPLGSLCTSTSASRTAGASIGWSFGGAAGQSFGVAKGDP